MIDKLYINKKLSNRYRDRLSVFFCCSAFFLIVFNKTFFVNEIRGVLASFLVLNLKVFEEIKTDFKKDKVRDFIYHKKIEYEKSFLEKENNKLLKLLKISNEEEKKDFINCRIIGRGIDDWCSFVIINKGKNNDLKLKDTVVYFCDGLFCLVGEVLEVYDTYSKVLLVSDIRASVSCFIPGKDIYGVLFGVNFYRLEMRLIDCKEDSILEVGDDVFTSGMGGVFNSGIYVGKIYSIEKDLNGNIEKVLVDLYDDFMKFKYLSVIKN